MPPQVWIRSYIRMNNPIKYDRFYDEEYMDFNTWSKGTTDEVLTTEFQPLAGPLMDPNVIDPATNAWSACWIG